MKILIVTRDSNIGGGITSSAVAFCNELSKRGNQVVFLDMSEKYQCAEQLNSNVAKGYFVDKSRYWNLRAKDLKGIRGFSKLKLMILGAIKKITIRSGLWYKLIFSKYQEFGEFDVAIAFRQCASCYSFILNKVKAKKKIGFVHGDLKDMGDIASWKKYMPKFDKIAYVSNAVKEGFIETYPELSNNATTIYNMLDFTSIINRSKEDSDIIFEKDKINIVTISRIQNNQKGTDRIAPICKKLKESKIVNFAWYVLGDGPDYERCMQQAKDMDVTDVLSFCGVRENPYPYLRQATFSVLPTKGESFGLVVIESLILHKPVVACEYPALKELLEDGILGLIASQDEETLYFAVRKMIEDKELRAKLCANCFKYKYSNDKAYQQFLEAIK